MSLPRRLRVHVLMLPSVALLVLLVVVPLVTLAYFSLVVGGDFTWANYSRLVRTTLYERLYWKSIWTALLVTAITAAVAWPAGWALSRLPPRRKPLLLSLVIVPYLTSYLLLIYAVFVLLAGGGPLMSLLGLLHLAPSDASVVYTQTATVLMLVYENLPIMLLVLYAASERIDDTLLAAARSLGAGRWQVFRRVVLPLSAPSLLAGATLVFIPVAGAFVEPQILGGPNGVLIGNVINDQISLVDNGPFGAALSLVLLLVILVVVGIVNLAARLPRLVRGRGFRLAAEAT